MDRYIHKETPIKTLRWSSLNENISDCGRENGHSDANGDIQNYKQTKQSWWAFRDILDGAIQTPLWDTRHK